MVHLAYGHQGFMTQLRRGLVVGLVAALLAFPCAPLAAALASGAGHVHVAAGAASPHSEHGEVDCVRPAAEHEDSCCNSCSSWIAERFFDSGTAVLSHAPQLQPVLATLTYTVVHVIPDRGSTNPTGPPFVASLEGTHTYLKTQRFRI